MDIDLDFKPSFDPRTVFPQAVPASMVRDDDLAKHPCGHYFQDIAVDDVTGWAAIPYEEAEVMGFFKIDFLHLSTLDYFESKREIRALLKRSPDWSLLLDERHVSKLFQISKHHAIISQVPPQSIQELADIVALIRPNKRHLLNDYKKNKTKIRPMLYRQGSDDKSSFKRSHALAYSMTIVLQLHLIEAGVL